MAGEEYQRLVRLRRSLPSRDTLVIITDAKCRVPSESNKRLLNWRHSAHVRAVALVIGSAPGDLVNVCDEVHQVSALDPSDEAVGRVLSL
jgi:hypothetical protein